MRALIATKNPGKIQGAKNALERYFENVEIEGIAVKSGVPEQPVNEQIYEGAKNRVENLMKYAKENNLTADLFLSAESGIFNSFGAWENTNMVLIVDKEGVESMALSPSFPVPERYIDEIVETDFSKVISKLFSKDDERHNKGGAIQVLTNGEITRIQLTELAFIMALTKYINGETWK